MISGEGSNLQALLDDFRAPSPSAPAEPRVEIAAVASSRSDARGLERAERAGIETAVFSLAEEPDREQRDEALAGWLEQRGVELVVLAGFMELLTPAFIRRFVGRIVNVHPALLPSFPGLGAIEQAVEHGVKVAGVTIHFVDEGVDSGPIVLQEAFELPYHRHIAEVRQRFHEVEHALLPRAVRLIAAGRVSLDPDNPRLVRVEGDG